MDAHVSRGTRVLQIAMTALGAVVAYFLLAYGSGLSRSAEPVETGIGIALCAVVTAGLVAAAASSPTFGATAGAVILLLAFVAIVSAWGSAPSANPSVIDFGPIFLLGGVVPAVWTAGITTLVIAGTTRSRRARRADGRTP